MTDATSGCCGGLARGGAAEAAPLPEARTGGGAPGDVVWFEGGPSFVGTDRPMLKPDGEGPRRKVQLRPYGLERSTVTNGRFRDFVAATGYVTEAERFGWSFVFQLFVDPTVTAPAPNEVPWWRAIDGATWAAPEGPGSSIEDRLEHPVVHVTWNDARAFAAWCGGRLPTEAEWEHAARGGPEDRRYPWGDEEPSDRTILCNIWQGRFPDLNTAVDGYLGTAPAESFAPGPAGLFNMVGNVWEWCEDPFRIRSMARDARVRDRAAVAEKERLMKGGSYLCHISYCYRYRIAARMGRSPDTSTGHTGFRIAYDAPAGSRPTRA
ncbi:formylglycine-generating enzyme family protein [Prosthecomicrobium sp. N25]|uniref:formylglycine-generating enzyme family protein n=1 Tax=Prosthecomicrobium sp. N25 TaxID=3129254 RepID=UPI003077125E